MNPSPPKHAMRFLHWFCKPDFLEEIEGDLVELFEKRHISSPRKARWRFLWDVLKTFRWINLRSITINNLVMNSIRNYIKVYFRRFRKETTHYLINILGLGLGFAVLFFILTYVHDEYHIDHFHSKSDRIYRVLEKSTSEEGEVSHYSVTSNMLFEGLKTDFPEVEETARMIYLGSGGLRYEQTLFNDRSYAYATPSIFDILDFDIVAGNPKTEFNGLLSVVLNETTARRLFGDEEAVGKLVDLPGKVNGAEVVAVYKDLPKNSTYQFNTIYVSRFEQFPGRMGSWFSSYDSRGMTTWVLLKENANPQAVEAKRGAFLEKYFEEDDRRQHEFYLQPIGDMHLGSSHLEEWGPEPLLALPFSKPEFVNIILLIGLFVVVVAALNYINLSSVQALKRSLEAGIRKVNGATIGQLRFQLLIETFMTLFIAYVLAVGLLVIFREQFLELANKSIKLEQFFTADLVIYHAIVFFSILILSSIIPAVYYSKLNRSLVLAKNPFTGKGDLLRKGFVIVQYGISLCLIIGSIVLYRQLNYVQTKDLGFKNERLLTLDINSGAARTNFRGILAGLTSHTSIENATTSSRVPGEWKYIPTVELTTTKGEDPVVATHYAVDGNWLDTYSIELIEGRNFRGVEASDTLKLLVNEKAVQSMGLDDPIGKMVWVSEDTISKMQIVGVIKDFHFESLHEELGPVAITSWNNPIIGIDYFTIKYKDDPQAAIAQIEKIQRQYDPETPAEVNFLDKQWERYYKSDMTRSRLILVATIISIIVSAFGLFGLINFTAERKTKEVGIRKVLGASITSILQVVLKDYVILLGIALVIAVPVSYFVLSSWLDAFAYRIALSVGIFLVAFLSVLLISLATVISRVYRLAKTDPVKSLRYE